MIRTRGTIFELDGKPLRLVGANCYFLGYCSSSARMPILTAIRRMGGNTCRAWAFLDCLSLPPAGQPAFQYSSGARILFNDGPDGLERLDALIADAEQAGVYLILPLANHWPDFGGAPMYLRWLGIAGPADEFYRQRAARDAYRQWVQHVLTRVNTRTQRAYRDEPSILAWELANEPQCDHAGAAVLTDWVAEMSALVKSLDPNHLVSAGDAGFFNKRGVNTESFLRLATIDFGTYHLYPDSLGEPNDYGREWIEKHLQLANKAGKPVILEEYGIRQDGDHVRSAEERDRWCGRWLESVRAGGGAGDLIWMAGSRHPEVAGFRDDYTIYDFSETPSLVEHAAVMQEPPTRSGDLDPLAPNALVFADLVNVEGKPIEEDGVVVAFLRDGVQVPADADPDSGGILVSASVRGTWNVAISAPGYLPANSDFFQLEEGGLRVVTQGMVRDRSEWHAAFVRWAALNAAFRGLKDRLADSPNLRLFPAGPPLHLDTEAQYDAVVGPDAVIAKTTLLNLYYRLTTLEDVASPPVTWFSFITELIEVGRERLIAKARPGLAAAVQSILAHPDGSGYHKAEDAEGHRHFLPAEYRQDAAIISIKESIQEASLQVTVSTLPGKDFVILDADIDEHGTLLPHIFDGIAHIFDGGTHPYDIHEYLIAWATARGETLMLGYDLEPGN